MRVYGRFSYIGPVPLAVPVRLLKESSKLFNNVASFPPPTSRLLRHLISISSPQLLVRRQPHFPRLHSAMDESTCSQLLLVVLCGKSSVEKEIAVSMNEKKSLKLIDGGDVEVSLQKPCDVFGTFRIDAYMKALATHCFGRFLIWSPRLPSTQDLVSQNFCEIPLGAVCVADFQFKGRGRSKNVWESPKGCLMFSFTLQMENGRILPLLQYVVSLAVTEAIKWVCKQNGFPQINVKIKWPNDLYLNGLKVGGVLCTSKYKSKKFNVSSGIGLNVDNEKPTTCLNAVLRELTSAVHQLRMEDILAAFFYKFENLFDVFLNQGFQALEELYYKTWLHSGQKVVIEEKIQGESINNVVVTIQGLTPSGYLLATDEDNKNYELHPDGNSLDFFKGLVRKKIE